MEKVVDSYTEFGGRHSGETFHETRCKALVFQEDELAQVLRALRRGSAKDKKLAKKAFYLDTGFTRCPLCCKLVRAMTYDSTVKGNWICHKCAIERRIKSGYSINKSDAKYFSREEYEKLAMQAGLMCVKLLKDTDYLYGEKIPQDILDCI